MMALARVTVVGHALEQVELAVAQGVVDRGPDLLDRHGGHAGDVDDGHVFRVGAGDGVDGAQFADTVGGADRADAVHARVAVGRVAGVEFVAATHVLDAGCWAIASSMGNA